MQHALVVSLIGFFGSWAIVLGQSCYHLKNTCGHIYYDYLKIFNFLWNGNMFDITHYICHKCVIFRSVPLCILWVATYVIIQIGLKCIFDIFFKM